MTNDYMFRAVLQSNNIALRGLICALLHLRQEDILSVEITNPIILGESVKDKEFRLEVKPVIHIGVLDYTLFDDCPEFYATYKLLNVKNYHLYNGTPTLSGVDLSHINLATDDDKRYHIDYWAKLFNAATWEDIKMLASKDQYIDEASRTIFQLSADEQIRKRCLEREEYYLDLRAYERVIAEKDALIQKLLAENTKLKAVTEK